MAIVLGPILAFRGISNGLWNVSVLIVLEGDAGLGSISWNTDEQRGNAPAVELHAWGMRRILRFEIAIPQPANKASTTCNYDVPGKGKFQFAVPGSAKRPRIAFASCNGFSDPTVMKKVADPLAMWKVLQREHQRAAYNVLLMGGDQVYADSLWSGAVPEAYSWAKKSRSQRIKSPFDDSFSEQVEAHYRDVVYQRWEDSEVAQVFASIPTIMVWDDPDIFVGWGSYSTSLQKCPVYQGIFGIAHSFYRLFQLQLAVDEKSAGSIAGQLSYNRAFVLGELGILCLDLSSERTESQVMSAKSWDAAFASLTQDATTLSHLLVVCSVPVIHPSFRFMESLFRWLPGEQELEDDLQDQWSSRPHAEERIRLIHRLLDFSRKAECRVTILPGDVHVGALGVIRSERETTVGNARVINQLTSSGIVHPQPPAAVTFYLESASRNGKEFIGRDIEGEMLPFSSTDRRIIGARNFPTIEADTDESNRLWAKWFVEGESRRYVRVIHPC